jgi:hypothetical protein
MLEAAHRRDYRAPAGSEQARGRQAAPRYPRPQGRAADERGLPPPRHVQRYIDGRPERPWSHIRPGQRSLHRALAGRRLVVRRRNLARLSAFGRKAAGRVHILAPARGRARKLVSPRRPGGRRHLEGPIPSSNKCLETKQRHCSRLARFVEFNPTGRPRPVHVLPAGRAGWQGRRKPRRPHYAGRAEGACG